MNTVVILGDAPPWPSQEDDALQSPLRRLTELDDGSARPVLRAELDLVLLFALYQSLPEILEVVSTLVQVVNPHTKRRIVAFKLYQRQ
jgi:hypothetical protein